MPTIFLNRDMGIAETANNVIAGELNEFLGANSVVRYAAVAELTGLFSTFIIDTAILIHDQFVKVAGVDVGPQDPEDVVSEAVGAQGSRLTVGVRNTNAATNEITLFLKSVAI